MDWIAILVICGIAALAGALLYLPFFIWFRIRAKKSRAAVASSVRYTAAGWLFIILMLAALLGGFAVGQLAPTSWFGAQVTTVLGGFGYFFLVWISFCAIEWGFRRLGIPFVSPLPLTHSEMCSQKADSRH
ncbi:hypothetical protein [Acidovorax sp.]|uniref:hypothetical protein n=1 Tax=Acidovorax sp. TaxID=1872122 RepID=UPI003D0340BD